MTTLIEKIKADPRIRAAVEKQKRRTRRALLIYAAVVLYLAVGFCLLSKAKPPVFVGLLFLAAAVIALPALLLVRQRRPRIFWGEVTRIEEEWRRVPAKGTGAFGRLPSYTVEVRELHIAITDAEGRVHVIFCPQQYEKVIKQGDRLLCHSVLKYPAHLSNPTKCICMHCGTMQSSENGTCIGCGAEMYHLYALLGKQTAEK